MPILTLILAATLVARPPAADSVPPGARCPVMPDQLAVPEHRAEHRGREVYFCCEACVRKFRENPDAYLIEPPPPAAGITPSVEPAAPSETRPASGDRGADAAVAVVEFAKRHGGLLLYAVGATLLVLGLRWVVGRARPGGRVARWVRPVSRFGTLAVLLMAGATVAAWDEAGRARAEAEAARELSRKAPPAAPTGPHQSPARFASWAWPHGFHDLPRGLENTYYRGNDERSDRLFNGGNYRTVTFQVGVRSEDGRPVREGDRVPDQQLRVRFGVVRAPKTAGHYFRPDQMARAFVYSAQPETEPTPVPLAVVRPDQEWTAELPIARPVPAEGYARLDGLWCVCVGVGSKPDPATAVVHYYIRCVVHVRGGVVLPESAVWMVPVFASPILAGPRADGEWFSDRPIPEIPDGNRETPRGP